MARTSCLDIGTFETFSGVERGIPVPLSKEAIEEFGGIRKREFNDTLSFDHAKMKAENFLECWKTSQPLSGEQ